MPRLLIQVSHARLGAEFVSALADVIPIRIPAHPRGALLDGLRFTIDGSNKTQNS